MPPRKQPPKPQPEAPQLPQNQPPAHPPTSALTSVLPEKLDIKFPNFGTLAPTNWYRPSTSPVERVDQATFQEESLIAEEQGNALELMGSNLDNVAKAMQNAVKATKIGKLLAEYLVGLEAIKTVGVSLRNAQKVTVNEEKRGLLIDEQGVRLDTQLVGERNKTAIESGKNALSQLEVSYYNSLAETKQTEWNNKLLAAEEKARLALQGAKP